jgi:hypothetical protein
MLSIVLLNVVAPFHLQCMCGKWRCLSVNVDVSKQGLYGNIDELQVVDSIIVDEMLLEEMTQDKMTCSHSENFKLQSQ